MNAHPRLNNNMYNKKERPPIVDFTRRINEGIVRPSIFMLLILKLKIRVLAKIWRRFFQEVWVLVAAHKQVCNLPGKAATANALPFGRVPARGGRR